MKLFTKSLNFAYLAIITSFICCNNTNDFKIVKNKYLITLNSHRISIIENSGFKPETGRIIPLLDTIIDQIERTDELKTEVKNILYSNITNWKNNKMYDPPEPYEFLMLNKDNFLQGNMSTIESLDFIEKYFAFNYWINWSCNDSFHELVSLVKIDTLYLISEKEYELQLQMQYNEIPSIRILSNTIEGTKPNRIKFKTGGYFPGVQTKPFEVKAINDAIQQIYTFEDTIKYITIKND